MYGIVNKAIRDLVVSDHGTQAWEVVRETAGVEEDFLISDQPYPDDVTYRLVGAASQVLGYSVDQILMDFGEHWILKTGQESYGSLLRSAGDNLREFLLHLPRFHSRVFLLYPNLKPPEFECSDVTDNSIRLHYYTDRPGLTSFMVGLLRGLGKLYETPLEITISASKQDGSDHDIFDIRWGSVAS